MEIFSLGKNFGRPGAANLPLCDLGRKRHRGRGMAGVCFAHPVGDAGRVTGGAAEVVWSWDQPAAGG